MSTTMAIVLLGDLRWLIPDHPSRIGEKGRGDGVSPFEVFLGGSRTQCLHNGRDEEPVQHLHCQAQQRWGGRCSPGLLGSLPSRLGL